MNQDLNVFTRERGQTLKKKPRRDVSGAAANRG